MKWESVSWLQETFMTWFNAERLKKILTFPVESISLLNDGKDFVDPAWAEKAAQKWAEGHSFFCYTSDSVDSLSSCCFAPSTKILARSSKGVHYTTIKEFHDLLWTEKKNPTVFHNGNWVRAKTIKLPKRQMYRVTTANHKEYETTDNHLWPTLSGLKKTEELTDNDWLMFSTMPLSAVPEKDRKLTYEQGLLIGAYLGDGSIESRTIKEGKYYAVNYSLNEEKYAKLIRKMNKGLADCGIDAEFTLESVYNNVYPVYLYGKQLRDFIREYVEGNYCYEKHLKSNVLEQSLDFRKGILDGYYATDGGNSNRIYTTSPALVEDMEILCTSLGLVTVIECSDRTDEPVIIRDREYTRNFPLYCIRWYSFGAKRKMGNIYKIVNNCLYFKINSVTPVESNYENVYCFECKDQSEPYFTLPSGLITHNCRLRNEVQDNQFSYTLGAGGVSTGSKCVMTININRLVQNAKKQGIPVSLAVEVQVEKMHKYLLAFNEILKDRMACHMLPVYDAGFIDMKKQYLTIGM